MTAEAEAAWWSDPPGGRRVNAWSDPPYSSFAAADVIDREVHPAVGSTILDLGCGPCRTAAQVANLTAAIVVGVDSSADMLNEPMPPHPGIVHRVLGDGRTIPSGIAFDNAYSITMFEHIPHTATMSYMGQIRRLLPDGGRFLFTHTPGDDPQAFLHHQCGQPTAPIEWAIDIGFAGCRFVDIPPVLEACGAWKWYLAWA